MINIGVEIKTIVCIDNLSTTTMGHHQMWQEAVDIIWRIIIEEDVDVGLE